MSRASAIYLSRFATSAASFSAILRNRNEAAVAVLGNVAPYSLGIARVAGEHRVDDDVLLFRHRQRGRIFGVLRVVDVRRRVANQEHDPPDVAGRRPAQFVDGDVERFVDALRPIAAAAGLQLQQVGVEVMDIGGEIEVLVTYSSPISR